PDRSAEHESEGPAEPPPRSRFRRLRRSGEPVELDLRENLAEPVANRALDFARVVGGHKSGQGIRTKRNFDQEPRRLALVDHRFQSRILDQHRLTSSTKGSAGALMGQSVRAHGANEKRAKFPPPSRAPSAEWRRSPRRIPASGWARQPRARPPNGRARQSPRSAGSDADERSGRPLRTRAHAGRTRAGDRRASGTRTAPEPGRRS